MSRLAVGLVGAVIACGAVPAQAAGWVVQGIPGASCQTDSRSAGSWEYRGARLLNTDTNPYGIVVAVCPISVNAPGLQPREYRISLRDSQERDAWCKTYSYNGTLIHNQWMDWDRGQVTGRLDYPLAWSPGLVETTIHCLVNAGASIDRIEVHWWQP